MNAMLLTVATLCAMVYFFFSVEHKGLVGKIAKVGIWFLMITFGASFGYTVMGRNCTLGCSPRILVWRLAAFHSIELVQL